MPVAKEIRPDRVAVYIRWSTEDQAEGTTLEVQRDACQAFIVSQGWAVNPDLIFVDDGISGGTLDRPALTRLREQVQAGQVDCVVVYKLDRLSRSVVDMLNLALKEWEGRCYLKSAREPIDTINQTGKMFFYQLMSFAEWERNVIKERTFSGKLRRAMEGKNPGATPPFGYRVAPDGRWVINPDQATVVQLIFRLYLGGLGCVQIARRLNQEGHVTATGRPWAYGLVHRVLGNPLYKGTFVYGQKVTLAGGRKVKSDRPHVVKEGFAPAIVDAATFEAVQATRSERPGFRRGKGSGRSLGSQSLLTSLLKCTCGHAYCANGGTGARVRYRYYYCQGAAGRGDEFCAGGRIRQDVLDNLVVQALISQYMGPGARDKLLAQVTEGLTVQLREAQAAHDALARELDKVNDKDSRVRALFLDTKLTVEEFRDLKAELFAKQTELRDQLAAAKTRVEQTARTLKDRRRLADQLARVSAWEELGHVERKQLLRQFVSQILAYRDKNTGHIQCAITWRWSGESAPPSTVHEVAQSRATDLVVNANRRRPRGDGGRFAASRPAPDGQ